MTDTMKPTDALGPLDPEVAAMDTLAAVLALRLVAGEPGPAGPTEPGTWVDPTDPAQHAEPEGSVA